MELDFSSSRPIYSQIIHEFSKAVARGELAPGDRIPSQRELAEQAKVNPNTVQRAYREMEQMQLTETLRGQGTFITNNPDLLSKLRSDLATQAVKAFLDEMSSLGLRGEDIAKIVQENLNSEVTKHG